MCKDLFRNEIKNCGSFHIYHDESGRYKTDRWFFVGLLFIPSNKIKYVEQKLFSIKKEFKAENYEIHFSKLAKECSQSKVAKKWLDVFYRELSNYSFFSCLALDTCSKSFDYKRFKEKFHAYNRFTAMALKGAIRWFFKDFDELEFLVISDEKSRKRKDIVDNFGEYIVSRVEEEWYDWGVEKIGEKLYFTKYAKYNQHIKFVDSVRIVSSKECIFLQLTDVLLGATAKCVTGDIQNETKLSLSRIVYQWILDIRKEPWKQEFGLHKKFNLWYFPDKNGKPYKDRELRIQECLEKNQMMLF